AAEDLKTSWGLLSSESRTQITAVEWENAFTRRPSVRKPAPSTLLRALVSAPTPPSVIEVLPRAAEALVRVAGSVQITQQIVLVREPAGWRVDLAASDRLNSAEAGRIFIDAIREEATASAPRRAGMPSASPSLLRALLAPQAKDYRVIEADVEADRAQVTVVAEMPVSLVLRAFRVGPGWTVDLTRPMLSVDATHPRPLKKAVAAADKASCEDQLRRLAKAIQMYAARSDDMFPDPERWLDQIRPHLPHPAGVHCPADSVEGVSYAMNRNLAGKRRREIGKQSTTPLLFESSLHTDNPADTGESWVDSPRHPGGNLVLFVDGSVRAAPKKPSFTVVNAEPGARPRPVRGRPSVRIPPRSAP
ncbi:MAG: hypothetical protein JSV79_07220, partial [Armatimonadota bacterium]